MAAVKQGAQAERLLGRLELLRVPLHSPFVVVPVHALSIGGLAGYSGGNTIPPAYTSSLLIPRTLMFHCRTRVPSFANRTLSTDTPRTGGAVRLRFVVGAKDGEAVREDGDELITPVAEGQMPHRVDEHSQVHTRGQSQGALAGMWWHR